jgi:hypothetical protein
MLIPKTGESTITTHWGRWLYCRDAADGQETYVHLECDMACDADGHCIGCGSPSPAALPIPATCPVCAANPCECFTNAARLRRREV